MANIVKDLLGEHDRVSLDGIGVFCVLDTPASFTDRGFTIHPPYRKVTFCQEEATDEYVLECYCSANDVDKATARKILSDYFAALKKEICESKVVELPGLGRLRATRENSIFFVQDSSVTLFPEYDVLEPVSLKSLPAESEAPEQSQPSVVFQPEAQPQPMPAREFQPEPQPEPEPEPQPAPQPAYVPALKTAPRQEPLRTKPPRVRKPLPLWAVVAIAVAALCVVLLGLLAIVGRTAPQLVDPLLYNAEQLRILYTKI